MGLKKGIKCRTFMPFFFPMILCIEQALIIMNSMISGMLKEYTIFTAIDLNHSTYSK